MGLFREAIEGNEPILVQELDVEHGLWIRLQAKKVLTEEQLANCKTQVSWSFIVAFECFMSSCLLYRSKRSFSTRSTATWFIILQFYLCDFLHR